MGFKLCCLGGDWRGTLDNCIALYELSGWTYVLPEWGVESSGDHPESCIVMDSSGKEYTPYNFITGGNFREPCTPEERDALNLINLLWNRYGEPILGTIPSSYVEKTNERFPQLLKGGLRR